MNNLEQVKIEYVKKTYESLVDELTLDQYHRIMGGDMSFESKARRCKEVSKSKNVHFLANLIIYLTSGDKSGLDALQLYNVNRHLKVLFK